MIFVIKKPIIVLIVFFIIGAYITPANACSHYTASIGETILVANNKDTGHTHSHVWIHPASEGNYGRIYFGLIEGIPNGWTYINCGMNDQGLFIDAADVPASNINNHTDKPLYSGNLRPLILEKSSTVNETIGLLDQYRYDTIWDKQYLVADRNGDAILISAGTDGELNFTRKQGIYLHGANFNIADPYANFEVGWRDYPSWRYNTGKEMLDKISHEDNISIDYFKDILQATSQSWTKFSNIYDLRNGLIYVYRLINFDEIVILNLEDELIKGEYNASIDELFQNIQDYNYTLIPGTTSEPTTAIPENYILLYSLSFLIMSIILIKKRRIN
ncbi:MAG: hypothetical protein ACXAC7_01990 [Candidatus Hodarchaeales archaeon]|jgi:hypothetical protein